MTEIKRRAKRLFAGLLGLLMALSLLSTTAFAKDGAATIVVTLPTGDAVKDVDMSDIMVTPYLVLDQVNPDETDPSKKQYEVTEGFKEFFDHKDKELPEEGFDSDLVDAFANVSAGNSVYLYYDGTKLSATVATTDPTDGKQYIKFSGDNAKALDATYPEAELLSRITSTGDQSILYTWIEKYIKAKAGTLNPAKPESGVDQNGTTMTISGLNEGYYALLFDNTPSAIVIKQGILIATKGTDAEMELKYETPPLEKTVKNKDHTTPATENFGTETTADVGDELTYQITTTVPTLANSENLTIFKMEDTMQNQQLTGTMTLTLTKEGEDTVSYTATVPAIVQGTTSATASFTGNGKTIATLTVNAYGPNSSTGVNEQTFIVDFKAQNLSDDIANYQGYHVQLLYNAMVTADAVQVNGNDVKLYINNDDKPLEDSTDVYTYGIEVQKKFSDGSTDKYDDVTFTLYPDKDGSKDDTALKFMEVTNGETGSYRKPVGSSETGDTVLKLDGSGKLTITGLDVGTYWLVETHTADGYSVSDDIKIVLVANPDQKENLLQSTAGTTDGTYAQLGGTGDNLATVQNNEGSISLAKFDVLNQKGFNLPQTGGAGTWMFTIGGILLVAAAGVLFALSRKKDGSK